MLKYKWVCSARQGFKTSKIYTFKFDVIIKYVKFVTIRLPALRDVASTEVTAPVKQWSHLTAYDASPASVPHRFHFNSIRRLPFSCEHWRMVLRNAEISIWVLENVHSEVEQWRTIQNVRRIVMKICYSNRTMQQLCSLTNWNPVSAICFAHKPISLHQLRVGVPSFDPVFKQFWRLATFNWKKV